MTITADVIIVGAGAAGLTAAHDLINLKDSGLSVVILEARDRIGGRVSKLEGFASDNVPIDLGGEWLATDKSFLDDISGASFTGTLDSTYRAPPSRAVETIPWDPIEYQYNDKDGSWDTPMPRETMQKFVNSTWYDFFYAYLATPDVMDSVIFDCAITTVDHSNVDAPVVANCGDGRSFQAQQIIITVPIPIMKNDVAFIPGLPDEHQDAIDSQDMLAGLKVVMHFQEKFYHDVFMLDEWDYNKESGNYYYNPFYNAAHDLDKPKNVLIGSFYGAFATDYVNLSDEQLLSTMLSELDRVYGNNVASSNLLDSYVYNWNAQEFTRGIYSNGDGAKKAAVLREPTPDGTIIFAGEAIPPEGIYYGYVHGAAYSGRRAADLVTAQPGLTPEPKKETYSDEGRYPFDPSFWNP